MPTPDELIPLAEAGDDDALASLASFPLDAALAERFAGSSAPALQSLAAAHDATPAPALRALAGVNDLRLRTELLDRDDLDEEALLALAESEALIPRILARPDCPMPLLLDAGSSNQPRIQRLVAAHPRAPNDVLDALTRRSSDTEVEAILWERLSPDPERLPPFASALSPELRTRYARHPDADPALLARLATDLDDDVREAVAGHPALAPDLVFALAADPSRLVARAARQHPACRRRRQVRMAMWLGISLIAMSCAGVVAAAIGTAWWLWPV